MRIRLAGRNAQIDKAMVDNLTKKIKNKFMILRLERLKIIY